MSAHRAGKHGAARVIELFLRSGEIDWKRRNEVDPIRFRPHPHEFEMYYDI